MALLLAPGTRLLLAPGVALLLRPEDGPPPSGPRPDPSRARVRRRGPDPSKGHARR
jgi:hypothetical protein